MKTKTCRTCKYTIPFKAFYNNKRYKDGKDTQCKFCKLSEEKQRVAKYQDRVVKQRECTECKTIKPYTEFHRNRGKVGGLCENCKDCRNTKIVEKRFGLEKGQLEKMKKEVDYSCEICYNKLPLAVDHCHTTGKIRGLLCNNCNNGLGRFQDNIDIIQTAIEYLKENK